VVTYALILANTIVFMYQLTLSQPELHRLMLLGGVVPVRWGHPDWAQAVGFPPAGLLPFFSSMFLHGGFWHLLSNMWILFIFGDNVEDRMGHFRFSVFYLAMGLLAGVAHTLTELTSVVPTIGASGAIAGVLGAYLVLYPRSRVLTVIPIFFYPLFLELPAFVFLGVWFLTQLLAGTMSAGGGAVGGVAWWAHIGGFIAGIVLHRFFLRRQWVDPVTVDAHSGQRVLIIDPERESRWPEER